MPISLGKRWVPPIPGIIPRFISSWANFASSEATLKAQAIAISFPPPKHGPSMEATVSLFKFASKSVIEFASLIKASAFALSPPSIISQISLTSAPAENMPRPVGGGPVITTALIFGSACASSKASFNSAKTCADNKLCGGVFIKIIVKSPFFLASTTFFSLTLSSFCFQKADKSVQRPNFFVNKNPRLLTADNFLPFFFFGKNFFAHFFFRPVQGPELGERKTDSQTTAGFNIFSRRNSFVKTQEGFICHAAHHSHKSFFGTKGSSLREVLFNYFHDILKTSIRLINIKTGAGFYPIAFLICQNFHQRRRLGAFDKTLKQYPCHMRGNIYPQIIKEHKRPHPPAEFNRLPVYFFGF